MFLPSQRFLLSSCLVAGLTAAAEPSPLPATGGFTVGICTHLGQMREPQTELISLARQAGINSLRDEVYWGEVEKEKGRLAVPEAYERYVQQAIQAGVAPLLDLTYGNGFYNDNGSPVTPDSLEGYARYAESVARHFKGRVHRYEIWNEWGGYLGIPAAKAQGQTPENYVALIKKVYPRLKAVDPTCEVIGGWMIGDYLDRIIELGGLNYLDGVSIHGYPYNAGSGRYLPEGWIEWVRTVDLALAKASPQRRIPFYVTETSWPTHVAADGTAPERAAAYVARMYLLAPTVSRLKGIYYYDLQDDGMDYLNAEYSFGLLDVSMTPKPAWFTLRDVAGLVANGRYLGRVPTADPEIWIVRYQRPDGAEVWALWSAHDDDRWRITLQTDRSQPTPLLLQKVGTGVPVRRAWGTPAWLDEAKAANRMVVTVTETPWLLSGDLRGVSVLPNGIRRQEFPEAKRPTKQTLHLPAAMAFATPLAARASVNEVEVAPGRPTAVTTLDDFETVQGWQIGGSHHGAKTAIRAVAEPVAVGKGAAELAYDFTGVKSALNTCDYAKRLPLPPGAKQLSLRVFGDGSGLSLWFRLVDGTGQYFSYYLGAVDWRGWKCCALDLGRPASSHWDGANDGKMHLPLAFDAVVLEGATSFVGSGRIVVDDLTVQADKAGTADDLAGSFHAQWNAGHLYLTVTVTDDIHSQTFSDTDLWRGDSLQLALQALPKDGPIPQTFTELTVALTKAGPKVYRHSAQKRADPGLLSGATAQIERRGERTVYRITLPVKAVDLPELTAGTVIGFSLVINDCDGGERKYLAWGDGIVAQKNPQTYNWLVLRP
ncbi:MAG: sugar-binding protein [Lentisphaeria bacterium]